MVVGRVVEVQTRRWVIDMACTAQSALQLSAVQLPGGAQRRRTGADELNMRHIFREGDLISAEVCQALSSETMCNWVSVLLQRGTWEWHTIPKQLNGIDSSTAIPLNRIVG